MRHANIDSLAPVNFASNIRKLYIASFLGGFTIFYNGVETLYYRHFHLSFGQISGLVSLGLLATIVLEIPTGSFADIHGKKKSLIVATMFNLAGLLFLATGSSFGAFLCGFILAGAGRAFNSGANNALLYDLLDSMDKTHEYLKHQSRMQSAFVGIDILSGSLGFLLFAINVRVPYVVSLVALACLIPVQLAIRDSTRRRPTEGNVFMVHVQQIKDGLAAIITSKVLIWLVVFTLVFYVVTNFFAQVINVPFLTEIKHITTQQLAVMGIISNTIQTSMIFFGLAAVGYSGGFVFYNSYLPEIATLDMQDNVSATGFTYGYIGSVILQLICFLFVLKPQWFGIVDKSFPARLSFLLVGVWWIGFAYIPFTTLPKGSPNAVTHHKNLIRGGFIELGKVWRQVKKMPVLKRYLPAFFFYSMGVQTIMLVATSFGAKELKMETSSLIQIILIIQLVAIGGATLMSRLSDKYGNIIVLAYVVVIWIMV